jgi:hypothetical protein
MSTAENIIRSMNHSALVTQENGNVVGIEEHWDSARDRRLYKLEYQSTPDGRRAIARVLYNPWGGSGRPNAGKGYAECHVDSSGLLCVGSNPSSSVETSSYDLATVIKRARLWCTTFSAWAEGGYRKSFNDIALGR